MTGEKRKTDKNTELFENFRLFLNYAVCRYLEKMTKLKPFIILTTMLRKTIISITIKQSFFALKYILKKGSRCWQDLLQCCVDLFLTYDIYA